MVITIANENIHIPVNIVKFDGDSWIDESGLNVLENLLGFRVSEAGIVDGSTLVVYRLIPPELEGLMEDTFCYNCTA